MEPSSGRAFIRICSLVLVLPVCACKKEPPPRAAPPARPTATRAPPAQPPAPSKPYVLEADHLDRYIDYQRKVIRASRDALQSIAKIGPDAGTVSTLVQSGGALRSQGNAMETARKESGLSQEDIHAIEPMVKDVTTEWMAAQTIDQNNMIRTLEDQVAHAPRDVRAQMEKTVNDLKAEQEARTKLTKEREKYGDANVDVLVSRKDALLQLFQEALGILSGGAPGAKAR